MPLSNFVKSFLRELSWFAKSNNPYVTSLIETGEVEPVLEMLLPGLREYPRPMLDWWLNYSLQLPSSQTDLAIIKDIVTRTVTYLDSYIVPTRTTTPALTITIPATPPPPPTGDEEDYDDHTIAESLIIDRLIGDVVYDHLFL